MKIASFISLGLAIISKLSSAVLSIWAIVEFILYLVKDGHKFNWSSVVWLSVSVGICICSYVALSVFAASVYKMEKSSRKYGWEKRLEEMRKQQSERLNQK